MLRSSMIGVYMHPSYLGVLFSSMCLRYDRVAKCMQACSIKVGVVCADLACTASTDLDA